MDIKIVERTEEKPQIIIKCQQVNNDIMRLKAYIEMFDKKLHAKKDKEWHFVDLSEVLYFESVDNRTFLYTKDKVIEIKEQLYKIEAELSDKDFIRISKSQIVNINKIKSLRPELNRTILATMCNGEHLCISRKYVRTIRSLLAI